MSKILIPRYSTLIPNKKSVDFFSGIPKKFPPEKFDKYTDWFYFTHLDPVQRIIHAYGMIFGYAIYLFCFYSLFFNFGIMTVLIFLVGVFFYYGTGVISHKLYDNGAGKTSPEYFYETFETVHRFNFQTLFGTYDKALRKFITKYPFVMEAYDLIEIEKKDLYKHLIKKKDLKLRQT